MNAPQPDRIDRLRRYVESDPDNVELVGEWVDALLDARRVDEAGAAVRRALARQSDNPPLRYRLAVIEQLSGDHAAAQEGLAALVDEGIDAPAVRLAWARSLWRLNRQDEALAVLDGIAPEALDDAIRPQATDLRTRCLHQAGRLDEAIAVAEAALQGGQGASPPLVSALATLYLDADRPDDARRLVRQAEQADRWDAELLTAGGFLALQDGQADMAAQRFRDSLTRARAEGRTHLGLGLALASQGSLEDAERSLQRATELMPSHLGSWHALAWMRLGRDDVNGACQAIETALEKDRNFADSHGAMAIVTLIQGDRVAAERWVRTGARLDPAAPTVAAAKAMLDSGATDIRDPRFVKKALAMLEQQAALSLPSTRTLLSAMRSMTTARP